MREIMNTYQEFHLWLNMLHVAERWNAWVTDRPVESAGCHLVDASDWQALAIGIASAAKWSETP